MRFLTALGVVSTAVLALASASVATPSAPTKVERKATLEVAIVKAMNRVRAAKGLRPLHAAPSLRTAARGHSQAMLAHGFFGHDSADGTAFSERIKRYYTSRGWVTWSVGEALLASQGTVVDADAIVTAWLGSPSHRALILSSTWRDTGIGAVYASSAPGEFAGADAVVITADFGLREGRTSGS
jgi:uncharacterized protein YkwD